MPLTMPLTRGNGTNGTLVRLARAYKHVNQVTLARKTGLPQSRISQIELDRYQPTQKEWARIWNALTSE